MAQLWSGSVLAPWASDAYNAFMPLNINQQIESSIQSFVAELTTLVKAAAVESVSSALGGQAASTRRGPGRPRGSGAKPSGGKPARRARKGRRSSGDLEATAAKFLAHVKANDGQRLEEIGRALKMDTADLKRPAQVLLAAKAVRTTGAKRSTR